MDESIKDIPQWVIWVNIALGLAMKLGLLGALGALVAKGWGLLEAWVVHQLETAKAKANENSLLAKTQVDDLFFDTLEKLVISTGQDIKEALKKQVEEGKIDPEVFKKKLHEDVKAKLANGLSEGKKELFQTAYKDLGAAADALIPAVVKKLKDGEKVTEAGNS